MTAHVCSALSVGGTGDARPRPGPTGFCHLLAGSGRPRVLVIAVLVAAELVLGETCGNGALVSPALLPSSRLIWTPQMESGLLCQPEAWAGGNPVLHRNG